MEREGTNVDGQGTGSDEDMKSYSEEMVRRDEAGASREAPQEGADEETPGAADGAGHRGNPPH